MELYAIVFNKNIYELLAKGPFQSIFCLGRTIQKALLWSRKAGSMLKRFDKATRCRAGLFMALTYLLCVLGPGLAYAVGGKQVAAPCFDDGLVVSTSHHHDGDEHVHHHASAVPAENGLTGHASHEHDGKSSQGPCCAMLCISGLPAHVTPDFAPLQVVSTRTPESFRGILGQGASRLYRPPIV